MPERSLDRTVRRRRLLVAVASFAASLASDAQTTDKVYRIGYLSIGSASSGYTRPPEAFRQRLHELGWDEVRRIAAGGVPSSRAVSLVRRAACFVS